MKNRTELAKHFNELGFKVGAEIGVLSGTYSMNLCRNIPGLKLYCIDPWGINERRYHSHDVRHRWDRKFEEAKLHLEPFDTTIIRKTSMDAVKDFKDESLDFVYIDGNHAYSFVRDDIREWTKKVRKGGIVAGHDYYLTRMGNIGVIMAVNEYVREHGYDLQLTDWDLGSEPYTEPDDHHFKIGDEQQPNWWFVK